MKRILILIALLPAMVQAQNDDTAHAIIARFTTMLNHDGLPADSLLVMETTVSYVDSRDTFVMRRWYTPPEMLRVEVWRGDTLTAGYCTNGTSRYRSYSTLDGWWKDTDSANFMRTVAAYDFRGPFLPNDTMGTHYTYAGTTTLKGMPLTVVRAERKEMYVRHYLFEQQSGLLLFIIEGDELSKGSSGRLYGHSQWKAYHEYLPVGESLLPSEESYLRDGMVTIMRTRAHFEARNDKIFNQDRL